MKEYFYEVDFTWKAERKGIITSPGLSEIDVSIPLFFHHGQKSKWTPEHLLIGAVSTSLMETFMSLAESSGLIVLGYKSQGFIRLEEKEKKYRPVEILIRQIIKIENEVEMSKAINLMDESEQSFPLRDAINIDIKIHPQIEYINKISSGKIGAGNRRG